MAEQRIKAVWKGTGAQPKYQEYGYGTGRSIPAQIWEQYGNPESNWEFVYADNSAQQSNSIAKFLNTPVWFYTTDEGPAYVLNRDDVPEDANDVLRGHVVDVYKLYGEARRKETASKPIAPKDLQVRRLKVFEALWKNMSDQAIGVSVDSRGMVTLSKEKEGDQSLLPFLLLSLNAKNSALVVGLNKFAESSAPKMTVSLNDIFSGSLPDVHKYLMNNEEGANEALKSLLSIKTKAEFDQALIKLVKDANIDSAESDESLKWEPKKPEQEVALQELNNDLSKIDESADDLAGKKGGSETIGEDKFAHLFGEVEDTRPEPVDERAEMRRRAEAAMRRQAGEALDSDVAPSPRADVAPYIQPVTYTPPTQLAPEPKPDLEIAPFDPFARTRREVKPFEPVRPKSDRIVPPPPPRRSVAEMVAALPARHTPEDIKNAQKEFMALMPQLTTGGISKGGQFINSIPDDVMETAVTKMKDENKMVLVMAFPGLFKMDDDGQVTLLPASARDVSAGRSVQNSKQRQQLAIALEEFSAKLDTMNFRTRMSLKSDEYSPIFLDNLPARSHLNGAEIKNLVSGAQAAFVKALVAASRRGDIMNPVINDLVEDVLDGKSIDLSRLGRNSEELSYTMGTLLSRINRFAYDTDDEGEITYTEFGSAVKRAADAGGISEKEVIEQIKETVLNNLLNVKRSHARIYNSGQQGTTQGIALGMMMGALRGGMKASLAKNNANNGLMHTVHDSYPEYVDELYGDRVFMSSDDMLTYTTLSGREVSISTSMWQYMHPVLPYYKNAAGDLMVSINGDEVNFTNLPTDQKEVMRDAFMEYLSDAVNPRLAAAIDSQDAKYFALQKYQEGLHGDELIGEALSRTLGSRVAIEKLEPTDSVYNEEHLDAAQQVLTSLNNHLLSGVAGILANNTYEGYDHLFPDKQSKVRAYMTAKVTNVMKDARKIADELGIGDANYDSFTRILEDSMKAYVADYASQVNDKSDGTFTSAAGYSAEYFSMITPIVAMMTDLRFKDKTFEFEGSADGDYFRHNIPTDRLIDMGAPSGNNFMDAEIKLKGFIFHIDGDEHAIVKDTNKTSGSADTIHRASYNGKTQIHDLETKIGKKDIEKAHLSYMSPNMRLTLLLGKKSGSVAIGGSRTLNLQYEREGAHTPLGMPKHERQRTQPKTNKYGLKYNGTSGVLNGKELNDVMSGYDGFGLSSVVSRG